MAKQFSSIDIIDTVRGTGIKERVPARTASTTNIDLSTNLVSTNIGGVVVSANDRVLLLGQTTAIENGIYIIQSGAGNSYRALDLATGDSTYGVYLAVLEGTYAKTVWHAGNGIIDTSDPAFKMSANYNYTSGDIFIGTSSNVLSKLSKPPDRSGILAMDMFGNSVWARRFVSPVVSLPLKETCYIRSKANIANYSAGVFTSVTFNFFNFDFVSPPTTGDRVIIMHQTNQTENGIFYISAPNTLIRAPDFNNNNETNAYCGDIVIYGPTGDMYSVISSIQYYGIEFDAFNLTFTKINGDTYTAGNGISINTLTISANLKTNGGIEIQSSQLALNLGATSITGTLAVSNGGTGLSSIVANAIMIGNGTSAVSTLAPVNFKTLVSTTTFSLSNTIYADTFNDGSGNKAFTSTANSTPAHWLNLGSVASDTDTTLSVLGTGTNSGINITTMGTGGFNLLGNTTKSGSARFYEVSTNGSNYIELKSPTSLAGNHSFTLPTDGTADQILKTDGSGGLSFVSATTLPVRINTILVIDPILVNTTSYTDVATFSYNISRYGSGSSCAIIFESAGATNVSLQVYNDTNATALLTQTGISAGFYSYSFTAATNDFRLVVRFLKAAGVSPTIHGLQLAIY